MERSEEYADFLTRKSIYVQPCGFDVSPSSINPKLYEFQRDIVRWGVRKGKCAFFEDCGLGKTIQELVWSEHVNAHTGMPVLNCAPLAVSQQTKREGEKFGIDVKIVREQSECGRGINITNYEMLENFDPREFGGIVLDESSILKGDGPLRKRITEFASHIPFRLAGTATPAPNDHMELGNHAEFLGIMSKTEMLATFFVHDGGDTSKWRLKGHAESAFWRWVASWAVMIRRPSDLGYDDGGFILPPIYYHQHTVPAEWSSDYLFPVEAQSLQDRQSARRDSLDARVKLCSGLVNESGQSWVVWCDLNAESEALATHIPGSIEVRGSDPIDWKEAAIGWFTEGRCLYADFPGRFSGCHRTSKSDKQKSNTCKSGIEKTESMSGNIDNREPRNATLIGENDTPATSLSEYRLGKPSRDGKLKIQTRGSVSASKHMESPSQNTETCWSDSKENAPSVDEIKTWTISDSSASTLTIPTYPGKLEDSYARPAISASESSLTIHAFSKRQHCICGCTSPQRVLISKPSIFGLGLNLQCCHNTAFVGLSDSWEQVYQATRRIWRFGQKSPCHVHFITGELEGAVVRNIERKEKQAAQMAESMLGHMREINTAEIHGTIRETDSYRANRKAKVPAWLSA